MEVAIMVLEGTIVVSRQWVHWRVVWVAAVQGVCLVVEDDHLAGAIVVLLGVFQLEEEAFRVEARLGLSGWRTGWRLSWRKTRRVLPWRFFRGSRWRFSRCSRRLLSWRSRWWPRCSRWRRSRRAIWRHPGVANRRQSGQLNYPLCRSFRNQRSVH